MIKRREIAVHESCLNRSHDDEPLFVLRANDSIAPDIVRAWVRRYGSRKRAEHGALTAEQQAKMAEANQIALDMKKWRKENRS